MEAKDAEATTITKESAQDDYVLSHREKQIIRRIDRRVVLGAALVYSVNLMDHGNVGMAAIAG